MVGTFTGFDFLIFLFLFLYLFYMNPPYNCRRCDYKEVMGETYSVVHPVKPFIFFVLIKNRLIDY